MANSSSPHRLILHNFLSQQTCYELQFIHRSCSTVGYRPSVFSTTLSHLIATNSAHLIMPLVPIRDKLKEITEEHFGCEYELFIEFTGLISWCKGASIGWHSDDNRDYLKQRHFAVVCYLNSYEEDFKGGLFHFQDGEPSTFVPMAGDVLIYTADETNTHRVSEITEGERITLTLWLTRDATHDEDAMLVKSLSDYRAVENAPIVTSCYPVEASQNMYWFPPEQASVFKSGFDIRCGRLYVVGFDVCSESDFSSDRNSLEVLKEPLRLARGDELLSWEFVNILHALQVVQYYCWTKGSKELNTAEVSSVNNVRPLSELQRQNIKYLKKAVILKDDDEDRLYALFGQRQSLQFDKLSFSAALCEWEAYTCKLLKGITISLPYWIAHQSIFSVPQTELNPCTMLL